MSKQPQPSRPSATCLSTPAALEAHLDAIESAGGSVLRDKVAGVATATDPAGVVVLRAIRKCRRGHWILMFCDSTSVTWQTAATPRRSDRP
jgi:hypothetical protein